MRENSRPAITVYFLSLSLLSLLLFAACGQQSSLQSLDTPVKALRKSPFSTGVNAILYDDDDVSSIQSIGQAGQVHARVTCYWNEIEPVQDVWQFAPYDGLVQRATAASIPVLAIVGYSIKRVAGSDPGYGASSAISFYPPDNLQGFAAYAGTLAARYPSIRYWEVWNEPNNPAFWQPHPDAARYTEMLRLAYNAIKAANPGALVVLGGLSPGVGNGQANMVKATDFLSAVYDDEGANYFDVVGYHPYNDGVAPQQYLQDDVSSLRQVMVAHGDSDKKIWVTELDWFDGSASRAVSEQVQAQYLSSAFTILYNLDYVERVYWYNLRDYASSPQPANPALNYGLFRCDGSRRPSADAFLNF